MYLPRTVERISILRRRSWVITVPCWRAHAHAEARSSKLIGARFGEPCPPAGRGCWSAGSPAGAAASGREPTEGFALRVRDLLGRADAGGIGRRPIVVGQPSPTGGRRVRANGEILGLAFGTRNVEEFLRRAGLETSELIEARGVAPRCGSRPGRDPVWWSNAPPWG